jgi:hypothetical protein
MSKRTLEQWKEHIARSKAMEGGSMLSAEMKNIGGREFAEAMKIVDDRIEDPILRRRIRATFTVRTKYEALHEIVETMLADDPGLACDFIEAAASVDADHGGYLI